MAGENPNAPQTPDQLLAKAGNPFRGMAGTPVERLEPDPSFPARMVVKSSITRPNWNGGAETGIDPRDADTLAKDASIALKYVSMAVNIAGFGVAEFAKRDFKKDIDGARRNFEGAQENIRLAVDRANETAGTLGRMGVSLEGLHSELEAIRVELQAFASQIASLNSALNGFLQARALGESALATANAQLAYANNRQNFPPGLAGARAQAEARRQAQIAIAAARTTINTANQNISATSSELADVGNDYNETRNDGIAKANEISSLQSQITSTQSTLESQLRAIGGPMRQRADAVKDMAEAQKTYAAKMRTAFDLSQAAVGLTGASDTLQHIQAGKYYEAGASFISGTYTATIPYAGITELLPYTAVIQKAVVAAGRTLQSGGNWLDFAYDFGETTVGLKSAHQMILGMETASDMMKAPGREYEAWNLLVDQTAVGCEILGTIGETASNFVPSPIPVSAVAKPASRIAKNAVGGTGQTIVSMGYLSTKNRLMSAPLGSGQVSGASVTLFSGPAMILGAANDLTDLALGGNRPSANELIRQMVATGESALVPPPMRGDVFLRPTIPDAPNPLGTRFGPVYSGENVDDWTPE